MADTGTFNLYQSPVKGDSVTQSLDSLTNLAGTGGLEGLQKGNAITQSGKTQYQAGVSAAAPSLDVLSKLVKGDQADLITASQPEVNQVKSSFDAVRNIISQQPRGGGKTSALADATSKERQEQTDILTKKRSDATGQLGSLATTLAGLGISQEGVGVSEAGLGEGLLGLAANTDLSRRGQDMGPGSFASQFSGITNAISNLI